MAQRQTGARSRNAAVRAVFQAHGLRPTPIRLAVYRLLLAAGGPLAHTDVLAGLKPGRDRVTVYRALDGLVAHGLAHQVAFPDRRRRFAACIEHPPHRHAHSEDHAHFICNRCETAVCVGKKQALLKAVARLLPKAYALDGLDVLLYGLCPDCRKAG